MTVIEIKRFKLRRVEGTFTGIFELEINFGIVAGQEGDFVLAPLVSGANDGLDDGQLERDVRESKLEHTVLRHGVLVREAGDHDAHLVHATRDVAVKAAARRRGVTIAHHTHFAHVQPRVYAVLVEKLKQGARVQPTEACRARFRTLN